MVSKRKYDYDKIAELHLKGMRNRDIALELDMCPAKVSSIIIRTLRPQGIVPEKAFNPDAYVYKLRMRTGHVRDLIISQLTKEEIDWIESQLNDIRSTRKVSERDSVTVADLFIKMVIAAALDEDNDP